MSAVWDMDINFRDRELWYHSRRLIIHVFQVTATITDDNFDITKIMRNHCVAIASNIAVAFCTRHDAPAGDSESPGDGFGARKDQKKMMCFRSALTAARNLEQHLLRTRLQGILNAEDCDRVLKEIDTIKTNLTIGDSDRFN